MFKKSPSVSKAFTLIELLVVVAIIGILASIVLPSLQSVRDSAYLTRATKEMRSIHEALELYRNDFGSYPPDTSRDIPPGLEVYLAPGIWPEAAWPGSFLDWENWEDPDTGEKIYQISARFCPVGQPSQCKFPNEEWAEDFDINSAAYYCLSGPCRSHISEPIDHPGYCLNCGE